MMCIHLDVAEFLLMKQYLLRELLNISHSNHHMIELRFEETYSQVFMKIGVSSKKICKHSKVHAAFILGKAVFFSGLSLT